MTQANDSVLVTPGSGATIATHLANTKEYQVLMVADATGHLLKTQPTYVYWSALNAGASAKIHLDLFNAAGSGVILRVIGLFLQCGAQDETPVVFTFTLNQTSAVGTGGTVLTSRKVDSTNSAVPAQVTARHGATGGATVSFTYWPIYLDATNTSQPGSAQFGRINLVHTSPYAQDLTFQEGQGLSLVQSTSNTVATWSVHAIVTLE